MHNLTIYDFGNNVGLRELEAYVISRVFPILCERVLKKRRLCRLYRLDFNYNSVAHWRNPLISLDFPATLRVKFVKLGRFFTPNKC